MFSSVSSASWLSTLGLGHLGDFSLVPVFALLRDAGGGEWRAWPLHVIGMVERVAGMLGVLFDIAMGGDKAVGDGWAIGAVLVVVVERKAVGHETCHRRRVIGNCRTVLQPQANVRTSIVSSKLNQIRHSTAC